MGPEPRQNKSRMKRDRVGFSKKNFSKKPDQGHQRSGCTGPEAWEEEDRLGASVVPQAPGPLAVPAEVGPVLEHHERLLQDALAALGRGFDKAQSRADKRQFWREQDGGGAGGHEYISPWIHQNIPQTQRHAEPQLRAEGQESLTGVVKENIYRHKTW